MKNLTTEMRRRGGGESQRSGSACAKMILKGSPQIPSPVILSEAPRQGFPYAAEERGVEGSRQRVGLTCNIKAFSRELAGAPFFIQSSSGSFDSPSPSLGLAQDDRGRLLRRILKIVIAALREIFDESAYERFLARTRAARSVVSYREFLREREAAVVRKPRCC
jgi:Selenoprotein, putative